MLFPDRREPVGDGSVLDALRKSLHLHDGVLVGSQPIAIVVAELDAHELLEIMRCLDWHYPVPVMFRTHGEDRWSHATVIGRPLGEETEWTAT